MGQKRKLCSGGGATPGAGGGARADGREGRELKGKQGSREPKQTTHAEQRRKKRKDGWGPTGVTNKTDGGRRREKKPGLGSRDRAPVLWGGAQRRSRGKAPAWHNLEPPQPLSLLRLPTTARPAVMARGSTVLSTKPHSWMPTRQADISRARGNGPGRAGCAVLRGGGSSVRLAPQPG